MTPASLLEQAKYYTKDGLQRFGYVTRKDLSCIEFQGALATSRAYFPDRSYVGAVYDGRGALVKSTQRYNQGDLIPADPAIVDDLSSIGADRCEQDIALYGGILFPILGHFLFESLSRLWPLLWLNEAERWPTPIYFHHWPGLDVAQLEANPLYVQVLNALGIDFGTIRVIDRPIGFTRLIVPDTASAYHLHLDIRMNDVFDRVVRSILGGPSHAGAYANGPKVFLSRSRWNENRRIQNESGLDEMLDGRGFRVVHTELLPPRELIAMLATAGKVIATDGSHAHLAAFCKPGTPIIMLDTRPVPTQFAISALRPLRALHLPLYETEVFDPGGRITDFNLLDQFIDLALDAL